MPGAREDKIVIVIVSYPPAMTTPSPTVANSGGTATKGKVNILSFFTRASTSSNAGAEDKVEKAARAAAEVQSRLAATAQRQSRIETLFRGDIAATAKGDTGPLRQELSERAGAARSRLRKRRRAEGDAVLRQLRRLGCQGVGKVAVTAVDAEEDVVSEIEVVAAPVKSYAVRHRYVLLPPAGTAGGSGGSSSAPSFHRMVTDASTLRRVKFLQFYDDRRPAYYGTRRRKGGESKGRNHPVTSVGTLSGVDYEVDSEEEWEEGAEEGVSLSGSEGEDEGADGRELDYGDGWLCEDDQIEYKDGKMQDQLNAEGGKRRRIKAGGPRAAAKVMVGPLRLLADGALCMANGLDVDVAAVEAAAKTEREEREAKAAESSSPSSCSSPPSSSSSASSSSSSSSPKRARTGEAGGEDSFTPVKNIPMLRGVAGLAGAARLFQQYAAVSLTGDGLAPLCDGLLLYFKSNKR